MNPFTRLYRRSRAFRVICYVVMLLAILLVWIVSDDMWSNYTQVGDLIVFFAFLVFAAWAWWYGEDRDRRRAAKAARRNGAGPSHGDGRPSTTA
jgi:membrane protease YdiL (CAAX protease family)